MNIDYNMLTLLVGLVVSNAVTGTVMFLISSKIFVTPTDLAHTKDDIRKEHIEHCKECNKIKATNRRVDDVERDLKDQRADTSKKLDNLSDKIDLMNTNLNTQMNSMSVNIAKFFSEMSTTIVNSMKDKGK